MYKSNVGDFPLLNYPCKYWWVRYSCSCTFLSRKFEEIWNRKLEDLKKKYHIRHFGFQGIASLSEIRVSDEKSLKIAVGRFLNSKAIVIFENGKELEVVNTPLFSEIQKFFAEQSKAQWINCPYETDYQKKCPFYEPDDAYLFTTLEELRERKGYDLRDNG